VALQKKKSYKGKKTKKRIMRRTHSRGGRGEVIVSRLLLLEKKVEEHGKGLEKKDQAFTRVWVGGQPKAKREG